MLYLPRSLGTNSIVIGKFTDLAPGPHHHKNVREKVKDTGTGLMDGADD